MVIKKNKYDKRPFFKRIFGYCDCPCHKRHWFVYPVTVRMNTCYENEQANWVTCCKEYYDDWVAPLIEEMWAEYWASRI